MKLMESPSPNQTNWDHETTQYESIFHEMMVHVPLFLHPNPKSVLLIGNGSESAVREILRHTNVEKCILVETNEARIHQTVSVLQSPRLKTFVEEGSEWVKLKSLNAKFDVIWVNSNPTSELSKPLFETEFYADLKKILSPDGIMISQGGSPFYAEKTQETLAKNLKNHFKRVHFYNFSSPTEPGGLCSFSFASDSVHPLDDFSRTRVVTSGFDFDYYNIEIHEAAFFLPEFQKKRLFAHSNPL